MFLRMLRYLLDTNFCIRVLRNRPPELRQKFNENASFLCISDVVLYELYYGAECSEFPARNYKKIEDFISRLFVLPFDSKAGFHTAQIRRFLEKQGNVIGSYDLMIAGQARSLGLTVVTNNLKEFNRVPGLQCEDWH